MMLQLRSNLRFRQIFGRRLRDLLAKRRHERSAPGLSTQQT
jgi:hypothetical protein